MTPRITGLPVGVKESAQWTFAATISSLQGEDARLVPLAGPAPCRDLARRPGGSAE